MIVETFIFRKMLNQNLTERELLLYGIEKLMKYLEIVYQRNTELKP